MLKKVNYISLFPILSYSALIFYLSNQPQIPFPEMGILSWDKLLHFGAYFGYGVLMQIAVIPNATKKNKKYQIFIVILLSALFAVSDEIHQSFVPGRDADVFDVLADLVGALTSLLLYRRIEQIFKKERADE